MVEGRKRSKSPSLGMHEMTWGGRIGRCPPANPNPMALLPLRGEVSDVSSGNIAAGRFGPRSADPRSKPSSRTRIDLAPFWGIGRYRSRELVLKRAAAPCARVRLRGGGATAEEIRGFCQGERPGRRSWRHRAPSGKRAERVCSGLAAGGTWIRTLGPPALTRIFRNAGTDPTRRRGAETLRGTGDFPGIAMTLV
jgi:hypothetical protein